MHKIDTKVSESNVDETSCSILWGAAQAGRSVRGYQESSISMKEDVTNMGFKCVGMRCW